MRRLAAISDRAAANAVTVVRYRRSRHDHLVRWVQLRRDTKNPTSRLREVRFGDGGAFIGKRVRSGHRRVIERLLNTCDRDDGAAD